VSHRQVGYSFVELMFVLGLAVTTAGVAIPLLLASADDIRAAGAVRYLTARLHQVRMEAVVRSRDVGVHIVQGGEGYTYAVYADGNGDGIRTRDIDSGVDSRIASPERVPDRFKGVDFGVLPGLPPVESGTAAPGNDPIKLGSSNILTFTPLGSSSTGSLYVRGHRSLQYVIRVMGETGKTRVLKFNAQLRQWMP